MDFKKLKNKEMAKPQFLVVILFMAIVVIIALFLPKVGEWALYWIYYKPFYTLFKSSIYLPLYLHYTGSTLFIAALFILWIINSRKKTNKILLLIIMAAVMFLCLRNVYKDIVFASAEKYKTIECNIGSLERKRNSGRYGRYYYEIKSSEKIDGKYVQIRMDFYQYTELLKSKNGGNRIITVCYLPNTERMLKIYPCATVLNLDFQKINPVNQYNHIKITVQTKGKNV
ncbi:hypothetical protein FACS189430_04220 [Bacteroidia bacterium]|nr:hypothetical protein FACS189430_04220 [Bacteroidia bacterium]